MASGHWPHMAVDGMARKSYMQYMRMNAQLRLYTERLIPILDRTPLELEVNNSNKIYERVGLCVVSWSHLIYTCLNREIILAGKWS